MGSDAYATGEALYALNVAGGMPATDPGYAKGVKYLLNTQAADGSWHVASRSIWLQPYFDSGFPYGTDQWISAAATAWSTMALSVTVDPRPNALAPNSRAIVHCLGWQGEGVCPPAQPFGVVNAGRQGRSDLLEQRLWMGTAFLPGPITRVLAR